MANPIGYSIQFTDRPGVWQTDGYVGIGPDGEPDFSSVPSGIVADIIRNGVGNYSIELREPWYALLWLDVHSEIPGILSPTFAFTQLVSDDVGTASAPLITFKFVNGSGVAVELPSGSGFRFSIRLKQSSA
jgi:hypothetical protein